MLTKDISFRILVENPDVHVFSGEDTPTGTHRPRVNGTVILTSPHKVPVGKVKIALRGFRKVRWYVNYDSTQKVANKDRILCKGEILNRCTCTSQDAHGQETQLWSFSFEFDEPPRESIEGYSNASIVYCLHASAQIGKYLMRNIHATKAIRVMKISRPTINEDMITIEQNSTGALVESLEYDITSSPLRHDWGSPIRVKFRFSLLSKAFKMDQVRVEFLELVRLQAMLSKRAVFTEKQSVVASTTMDPEPFCEDEGLGACQQQSLVLPLPRSLNSCRQSVTEDRIKIAHVLRIHLSGTNSDGTSQATSVSFPYRLTIPSTTIFDLDRNAYEDGVTMQMESDEDMVPPPPFGEHQRDQLLEIV